MPGEGATFEVLQQDLAGRLGRLRVNGREVRTPELMPVINPNLLGIEGAITPEELLDVFGFRMLITNSYIINRTGGLREAALSRGLHDMLGFPGVIMTDSGTFQSFTYGTPGREEVEVDPIGIVRFQRDIGSDIGTILDRFTPPDATPEQARADLQETMERARASLPHRGTMELAVPVQGGTDMSLRLGSGKAVRDLDTGYVPIGGVVPLLESYRYRELVDVIASSKRGLGPLLPVHLFGAGHPMVLPVAVALGCDLFDSASYAKFAADGRYMTPSRTMHISEMEDLPCPCPVCSRTDAADLASMGGNERAPALARHNLWVLRSVLASIRTSISEGTLWEVVESSCANNPAMYSAVKRLSAHRDLLEGTAPRSTRRFMCSTDLSIARPEFGRAREDLPRAIGAAGSGPSYVIADPAMVHRPRTESRARALASKGYRVFVRTPLGPVPYEIFEMYPFSQMVLADPDDLPETLARLSLDSLAAIPGPISDIHAAGETVPEGRGYLDVIKVAMMVRYQFGPFNDIAADDLLFGGWRDPSELSRLLCLVSSKRTGKLRNVHLAEGGGKGAHLLSLRAEDGLFSLKWEGAKRFHEGTGDVWWRVFVESGTGEYNAKGFNVFCKFVKGADPRIRSGDEVMVVGEDDELYAVGRALLDGGSMTGSRTGIAVKVREGAEKAGKEGTD